MLADHIHTPSCCSRAKVRVFSTCVVRTRWRQLGLQPKQLNCRVDDDTRIQEIHGVCRCSATRQEEVALCRHACRCSRLSCLFVCHPHLTSIIVLTTVWHRHAGWNIKHLYHFRASLVHLSPRHRFCLCWCVGGSRITILQLLVQVVRIFAIVAMNGVCACWWTGHSITMLFFVQGSETGDPHRPRRLAGGTGFLSLWPTK